MGRKILLEQQQHDLEAIASRIEYQAGRLRTVITQMQKEGYETLEIHHFASLIDAMEQLRKYADAAEEGIARRKTDELRESVEGPKQKKSKRRSE